MDYNKKNKRPQRPNNKRGGNWRGLISLVCWALLLTSIFTYASDYMNGSAAAATTLEIKYSEYQTMVRRGQIEAVDFDNSEAILIVTPKEGFTYTTEDGVTYTKTGEDENGNGIVLFRRRPFCSITYHFR